MILRILTTACLLALSASLPAADPVLFIRGGTGTVGFLEGGSDEQGASIHNYATNGGNHGWGELHAALVAEDFAPVEVAENPVRGNTPTPIPLDTLDLSRYAVIVFGSNNAAYTAAQVDALMDYVADGGGALFISDANFGQNWGDAPSSDQHFLDRLGLTMNQDQGTYQVRRPNEFRVPTHPVLIGVDAFDGEGVSPITRSSIVPDVVTTVVTAARNQVRRNTGAGRGPSENANASDGTFVTALVGSGRIACHFDRNTFFNLNGAGTNLNRFDNEAYARNLFNWLAGRPDHDPATENYGPRAHFPDLAPGTTVPGGSDLSIDVIAKDPDGSVRHVELFLDDALVSRDTASPYRFTLTDLQPGTRQLRATVTDNDNATTDVHLEFTATDVSDLETRLPRNAWLLSSSPNNSQSELANAIDGNINSRWPTRQFQRPGQRFRIDFRTRQLFQRLVLETPNNPQDYPRGYIVRGSHDGTNFDTLTTGSGNGPTTDIVLAAPVAYRFVEVEQTGSSSNRWWSIHEINAYAPPANAVLPLDAWLQVHFGADPPALDADTDGDGLTTLAEFAFNTDPLEPSGLQLAVHSTGTDTVDLTFRRWRTEDHLTTTVEHSTDLKTWSANTLTTTVQSTVSNRDGTETVTVRVTLPPGTATHHLRLAFAVDP